jgi:hypothetical protein
MSQRTKVLWVGVVMFLLGCLVAPQLPFARAQDKPKGPKFLHGLTLSCRKSTEEDFTKETQKFGIEVFRDENNGNLVYVSQTGSIAVVAGK